MNVILDTDIGTDIDDCLALALILASPEIDLVGVTCVYADVDVRSQVAISMLDLHNRSDVPVYKGVSQPLLKMDDLYWQGHEGQAILSKYPAKRSAEAKHAVDYIIDTVRNHPKEITLVAIGPLTNVAMAFQKAPDIVENLANLVIMGSVVRNDLSLPLVEHNIKCDPEAAHIVFSSGTPITLTPLNITVQSYITTDDLQRIRAVDSDFHQAVADEIENYPRIKQFGHTSPHDPLAVASLINPELVTTVQTTVQVDIHSTIARGGMYFRDDPNGNIALTNSVDTEAFQNFLITRLEQPI
jgi:purine nucleosidase